MSADRGTSPAQLTILLCFLGAVCEGFDVQAAGVAAGGIIRELRPNSQTLGIFFAASGLGLMLGALAGGRMSDSIGRKPVLVASIAAFGVFSLLTSLASNMDLLIGARFLTGLGLGGAMPNLIALVADSSRSKSRTASIAAAYIGMPFGGAAASLVILAIPVDAWRLVFQIGAAAPLMIVPLMIRFLPRPAAAPEVAAAPWIAPNMARALFGHGRALKTLSLWISFFLIVLTLHLMLNWLPLLLTGRGLLKGEALIAQAGFNAGGGLIALWLAVVLDSRWRRIAIAVNVVMLPAMLALTALAPARPNTLIAVAFLLGGAILAQQVIVYAAAGTCYPPSDRGTGVGAAVAAGRLGSLTGPLFAGFLLAAGQSPSRVLMGVLPLVVVSSTFAGLLGWQDSRAQPS